MTFREMMLQASRWLDALAEDLENEEIRTVDGRLSRLEIASIENYRQLAAQRDALERRVRELEARPTAAHKTYETVHLTGGLYETREVETQRIACPTPAAAPRGHSYSVAAGNVPDPVTLTLNGGRS